MSDIKFSDLVGMTLSAIERRTVGTGRYLNEEMLFISEGGRKFRMSHDQDCCESVTIEDICGNLEDLIGSPIIQAEENTNDNHTGMERNESETWTFYRITTAKGQVVIRWFGTSNGYYSESVDFDELP